MKNRRKYRRCNHGQWNKYSAEKWQRDLEAMNSRQDIGRVDGFRKMIEDRGYARLLPGTTAVRHSEHANERRGDLDIDDGDRP
jgi:hypothetical protein